MPVHVVAERPYRTESWRWAPRGAVRVPIGGVVKLLLTSGGVTNTSIREALVGLLGRPIADSNALLIPTALYRHPWIGPGEHAWQVISGKSTHPLVDLGWKSVGVLELTALPSISEERWLPVVREADVLLAAGGDDRTAIAVVDGTVDVISEGHWKLFP